jgi:hypothetical protein
VCVWLKWSRLQAGCLADLRDIKETSKPPDELSENLQDQRRQDQKTLLQKTIMVSNITAVMVRSEAKTPRYGKTHGPSEQSEQASATHKLQRIRTSSSLVAGAQAHRQITPRPPSSTRTTSDNSRPTWLPKACNASARRRLRPVRCLNPKDSDRKDAS